MLMHVFITALYILSLSPVRHTVSDYSSEFYFTVGSSQ